MAKYIHTESRNVVFHAPAPCGRIQFKDGGFTSTTRDQDKFLRDLPGFGTSIIEDTGKATFKRLDMCIPRSRKV